MLEDVVDGYVSLKAAREEYGVVVEYVGDADRLVRPATLYRINEAATTALRRVATAS